MTLKWKKTRETELVNNKWLRVTENSYRLPGSGGEIPNYYITERADSALCVCFDGENFIMVEQYRAGIEAVTLCHPGGRIEPEDGSLILGAVRELGEETGYVPDKEKPVVKLGAFAQIPAVSKSWLHIFLVFCSHSPNQPKNLDETEELVVKKVKLSELNDLLIRGEIVCSACALASVLAVDYVRGWRGSSQV